MTIDSQSTLQASFAQYLKVKETTMKIIIQKQNSAPVAHVKAEDTIDNERARLASSGSSVGGDDYEDEDAPVPNHPTKEAHFHVSHPLPALSSSNKDTSVLLSPGTFYFILTNMVQAKSDIALEKKSLKPQTQHAPPSLTLWQLLKFLTLLHFLFTETWKKLGNTKNKAC